VYLALPLTVGGMCRRGFRSCICITRHKPWCELKRLIYH